jgi:S-adenosylhomocysteine hydrolase
MKLDRGLDNDMITIGYDNGLIEIVIDFNFDKRLINKFHDGKYGEITSAILNKDENFMISSGKDGLIYVHQFDKKCAVLEAKKDLLHGIEGVNFMAKDDKLKLEAKKLNEF